MPHALHICIYFSPMGKACKTLHSDWMLVDLHYLDDWRTKKIEFKSLVPKWFTKLFRRSLKHVLASCFSIQEDMMDQLRMMEEAPYFGWIWRVSTQRNYWKTWRLQSLKNHGGKEIEIISQPFTLVKGSCTWELPRKWKTSPRLYIPWTIWMLWLGCVHQRRQIPHGDLQLGGLDSDSWIDGTCKAGNVSCLINPQVGILQDIHGALGVCLNPVTAWK